MTLLVWYFLFTCSAELPGKPCALLEVPLTKAECVKIRPPAGLCLRSRR